MAELYWVFHNRTSQISYLCILVLLKQSLSNLPFREFLSLSTQCAL
jgi:hypothetical protein